MQLTPVINTELAVGQPLPWDIFDSDSKPVLARGSVVESAEQLTELTRVALFRDGTDPDAATSAPVPASAPDEPPGKFSFSDTRLKVGTRMQLELPSKLGGKCKTVRLIGYLESQCLFVSAAEIDAQAGMLIEGDEVRLRVFSGQYAFGFSCFVEKVQKQPVPYLHLSFPTRIAGKAVRKSRRIRTQIEAKITTAEGATVDCLICDLSATGAEVSTRSEAAKLGDSVTIDFQAVAHGMSAPIKASAVIRSLTQRANGSTPAVHWGIEFQDLSATDMFHIKSLVYQELVERPDTTV